MNTQAKRFGACIQTGTVWAIERSEDGFVVSASDRMFRAATVLIASGVADNLPDVPGFSEELILRDKVRLCPVCDGFEFIDRTFAVWGEAERSVKEALFMRAYSKSLVASGRVGASDRARLGEAGIEVVENPLEAGGAGECNRRNRCGWAREELRLHLSGDGFPAQDWTCRGR
jgi:thioredoxin reductase (NADPH)